ncbi:hypothetical protein BJX63DRAFT_41174 [Aspergillus granulosus]|uniref:Uncharacterized protein n=1 Tax=Aspergillus granulosus TaxID=176169 RepID=A0ABR4GYC0_9EURO
MLLWYAVLFCVAADQKAPPLSGRETVASQIWIGPYAVGPYYSKDLACQSAAFQPGAMKISSLFVPIVQQPSGLSLLTSALGLSFLIPSRRDFVSSQGVSLLVFSPLLLVPCSSYPYPPLCEDSCTGYHQMAPTTEVGCFQWIPAVVSPYKAALNPVQCIGNSSRGSSPKLMPFAA